MLSAIGGFLLVFGLRVCDVSLGTLRMLFTVQGRKFTAGTIGAVEVSIFLFAISKVVGTGGAMPWPKFLGYCLGFGCGTILGVTIEEWLAPGNLRATIISRDASMEVGDVLRSAGFGVTETLGRGKEGMVAILIVVTRRRDFPFLMELVQDKDPEAFVTTNDAHFVYRGFWHKIKRK
jgi:uncharacterized protein YebE (UPF0316 family)